MRVGPGNYYWSDNLTGWEAKYQKIIEDKIATLAEDNPREVKRLLNSTLLRATAAARHEDLDGNDSQRFTQGCQVYLMQCVLRKYVPKSASPLREDEALTFFERWSRFITANPDFRPRIDRAESEASVHLFRLCLRNHNVGTAR